MMTTDWTDQEFGDWGRSFFRAPFGVPFVFIDDSGYHCGEHMSCGAVMMGDRRFVAVQVPDCESPNLSDHVRLYDVKGCWPVDHPAVKEAFWKSERLKAWDHLRFVLDDLDEDALTVVQLGTLASEVEKMVAETKAKENE